MIDTHEKCPYSKISWSVFYRIWNEYGNLFPLSIQSECRKAQTKKNLKSDTFYAE